MSKGYVLTACVGDSRIYLLRDGKLAQITEDHSLVGELLRYNIIGEQDVLFLQNKNIITRALGMSDYVMVDTTCRESRRGDIFLLCSDGLTDVLTDQRIEQILNSHINELEKALETLVAEANEYGGQDNITATLAKHT
jgi:protein phosphatase